MNLVTQVKTPNCDKNLNDIHSQHYTLQSDRHGPMDEDALAYT